MKCPSSSSFSSWGILLLLRLVLVVQLPREISTSSTTSSSSSSSSTTTLSSIEVNEECLATVLANTQFAQAISECIISTTTADNDDDDDDDDATSSTSASWVVTTPIMKLQLDIDRNRMMHRLAAQYFEYQNFWMLFTPSVGITMISGILACLSDSIGLPLSDSMRGIFSTTISILSLLSVWIQSMSQELEYNHRAKEHEGITIELRNLYDTMKFEELVAMKKKSSSPTTTTIDKMTTEMVQDYEEKYQQIMTGCTSVIPTSIYNAYELATTRMELVFFYYDPQQQRMTQIQQQQRNGDESTHTNTISSSSTNNNNNNNGDWIRTMGIVNNEIFNAVSQYYWWPLRIPPAEVTVERAFATLDQLLHFDPTNNNNNNNNNGGTTSSRSTTTTTSTTTSLGNLYRLFQPQQQQHPQQQPPQRRAQQQQQQQQPESFHDNQKQEEDEKKDTANVIKEGTETEL